MGGARWLAPLPAKSAGRGPGDGSYRRDYIQLFRHAECSLLLWYLRVLR